MSTTVLPQGSRGPYVAEWEAVDDDGRMVVRELYVEDILPAMATGARVVDLMKMYDAPRGAIEHLIMMIPHLMVWRG